MMHDPSSLSDYIDRPKGQADLTTAAVYDFASSYIPNVTNRMRDIDGLSAVYLEDIWGPTLSKLSAASANCQNQGDHMT